MYPKVNLVWKRRLGSSATILFLVNRYTPLIYILMALEGEGFVRPVYEAYMEVL